MDIASATIDALSLLWRGDRTLWEIILTSLMVSTGALLLVVPVALPVAWLLATRHFFGRRTVLVFFQGFLSFPTVVVGLVLYLLLSRSGPLGAFQLLFTPTAMLLGQMIIAFPVLVVFSLSALQKNSPLMRETLRSLGASRWRACFTECIEARFGLLAAVLAGFGRIISEVGCALMVGGNIAHYTRTLPTAIALDTGKGNFIEGIALGIVLVAIALLISAAFAALQGDGRE